MSGPCGDHPFTQFHSYVAAQKPETCWRKRIPEPSLARLKNFKRYMVPSGGCGTSAVLRSEQVGLRNSLSLYKSKWSNGDLNSDCCTLSFLEAWTVDPARQLHVPPATQGRWWPMRAPAELLSNGSLTTRAPLFPGREYSGQAKQHHSRGWSLASRYPRSQQLRLRHRHTSMLAWPCRWSGQIRQWSCGGSLHSKNKNKTKTY